MELHDDLDLDLNNLIGEYGLLSTLEALKNVVEARVGAIASSTSDQTDEQAEAFRDVGRALTVLIKALPEEIDIQMALNQVTHVSSDLDDTNEKLAGGLE